MNPDIQIIEADLKNERHGRDIVFLTSEYASDRMGMNKPLPEEIKDRLIAGLAGIPTALIFLAYPDGKPVDIANCFMGFSTFAAKPLINIHDLGIVRDYRNMGIGRKLLAEVEKKAESLGCCKITLEVLEDNVNARHLYENSGFNPVTGGPGGKTLLFMSKTL